MELAQRIKAARLEAGLSQRQLCGDVITRNMLSLIEGGRARPSMDTLAHFSKILGKPISYFLEEDAVTSPNQQLMQQAENAYKAEEFPEVLELLESYRGPDPVFDQSRYFLEVLTCRKLARQAVAAGKTAYALELLERADAAGANTIYTADTIEPAVLRHRADPTTAASAQLQLSGGLLVQAEAAVLQKDYPRAERLLEACDVRGSRWRLLRGTVAMEQGQAESAIIHLAEAETAYPRQVVPLLEKCYLQVGDYRRAYEYAKKIN